MIFFRLFKYIFLIEFHCIFLNFIKYYQIMLIIIVRGRVGDFTFFDCSGPFCFLNLIELFPYFPYFIYKIQTNIIIVFWLLGVIGHRDLFFPCPLYFFPYSRLSSYRLRLFLFFILFHSCFPMRECLGKHSCMSSPLPITILNGPFFRETT